MYIEKSLNLSICHSKRFSSRKTHSCDRTLMVKSTNAFLAGLAGNVVIAAGSRCPDTVPRSNIRLSSPSSSSNFVLFVVTKESSGQNGSTGDRCKSRCSSYGLLPPAVVVEGVRVKALSAARATPAVAISVQSVATNPASAPPVDAEVDVSVLQLRSCVLLTVLSRLLDIKTM